MQCWSYICWHCRRRLLLLSGLSGLNHRLGNGYGCNSAMLCDRLLWFAMLSNHSWSFGHLAAIWFGHWYQWAIIKRMAQKPTKTQVIANNFCPFFPGKCQSEWDTKSEAKARDAAKGRGIARAAKIGFALAELSIACHRLHRFHGWYLYDRMNNSIAVCSVRSHSHSHCLFCSQLCSPLSRSSPLALPSVLCQLSLPMLSLSLSMLSPILSICWSNVTLFMLALVLEWSSGLIHKYCTSLIALRNDGRPTQTHTTRFII